MSKRIRNDNRITEEEASKILDEVLTECGKDKLSVPISDLMSYSAFRKENYGYQQNLLMAFIVLFALIPLFFMSPIVSTSDIVTGERGLPEFTVDVAGVLPVKSVVAVLNGIRLPVYEVNPHRFTIEPTHVGDIDLKVTLFNDQYVEKTVSVTDIDSEAPRFIKAERKDGLIYIYAKDDGVGVNFEDSFMLLPDSTVLIPLDYNADYNYVVFEDLGGSAEIYIPDNFENVVRIRY